MSLLALFLIVSAKAKENKSPTKTPSNQRSFPYISQGNLFSPAERSFLGVLEQCTPHRVFAKVRLADILKAKTSNRSEWQKAFNAISKKHVDFVLTDRDSTKILAVIELDDESHRRKDRQKRDQFVDTAFNAASIPIVHVQAKASYKVDELREALRAIDL